VTQGVGNFLGTCPLVVLEDEKNPDNGLRDKNLTVLLMELVTYGRCSTKTLPADRAARTEGRYSGRSRLYTTGNPSQSH
jgi:hypothetical protein